MEDNMAAVPESTKDQSKNLQVVKGRRTSDRFLPGIWIGVIGTLLVGLAIISIPQLLFTPPESDVTLPRSQIVPIQEGPLAGSIVVRYIGSISEPGVALIQKELEKLSRERTIWLSMESGGGDVEAATSLSKYINSAKIGLAIPDKAQCASACALMYAMAKRKYASPNAYFGFHYTTTSQTFSSFGSSTITFESYAPMTTKKIMGSLTNQIADQQTDLAAFFSSCSKGNPT